MGLICKIDCQIEIQPGLFKFIVQGQTHHDVDKKRPITLKDVNALSRKYFQLSGDDIKRDLQDKNKIVAALRKRNIRIPSGSRTTDVARLLAIDNKSRGIVNPLSLEIVAAPSHIADKGVIEAKARIDELFEITEPHQDRPYNDKTPLDELLKIVEKKEVELGGDPEGGAELTNDELKAKITDLGGAYGANDNKAKLKEILVALEKETEPDPE